MSKFLTLWQKSGSFQFVVLYAYVAAGLVALVSWIVFGNAADPAGGWFARRYGTSFATGEVAVGLGVLGLAGFLWALRMFQENLALERSVRRKLYRVASDIDFVSNLNTEVMLELNEKRLKDPTIKIVPGNAKAPYLRTLDGE